MPRDKRNSRSSSPESSTDSSSDSSQSNFRTRSKTQPLGETQRFTTGSARLKTAESKKLLERCATLRKKLLSARPDTAESKKVLERCATLRKKLLLRQRLRKFQEAQKREMAPNEELDEMIKFFEAEIKEQEERAAPCSKQQQRNDSVDEKHESSVSLTFEQRADVLQKIQKEWNKIQGQACSSAKEKECKVEAEKKTSTTAVHSPSQKKNLGKRVAQSLARSPSLPQSPKASSEAAKSTADGERKVATSPLRTPRTSPRPSPQRSPQPSPQPSAQREKEGKSTWDVEKVKAVASPMRLHRRLSLGTPQASPQANSQASLQQSPQREQKVDKMAIPMKDVMSIAMSPRPGEEPSPQGKKKADTVFTRIMSAAMAKMDQPEKAARIAKWEAMLSAAPKLDFSADGASSHEISDEWLSRQDRSNSLPPKRSHSEISMLGCGQSRKSDKVPGAMGPPRRGPGRVLSQQASSPGRGRSQTPTVAPGRDRSRTPSTMRKTIDRDLPKQRKTIDRDSPKQLKLDPLGYCPGRSKSLCRDREMPAARSASATRVSGRQAFTISQSREMLTMLLNNDDWKVRQAAVRDLMLLEEEALSAAGSAKIRRGRSVFCEPRDTQLREGEILEVSDDDSDLELLDVRNAQN